MTELTPDPPSSPSRQDAARALYRFLGRLPDWLIVVLFLTIAVILALDGSLDDWVRAALSICFGLLAIAFGARLIQRVEKHRTGTGPTGPS